MLTVSETCRMQVRSVFEFMVDAVTAHFANQTSPTWLPKSAKSEAASRAASFSFCSHRLVNAYAKEIRCFTEKGRSEDYALDKKLRYLQ